MKAQVFRPVRGWKGQIGNLEDYLLGEIAGVIIGGPSVQPVRGFPGVVSTEGQLGIPWEQASGIVVEQFDRVLIGDTLYAVVSKRLWTGDNVLTGSQPTYYWVDVQNN